MNDHPRILVIGGDPNTLRLQVMTLNEAGYTVLEASTGAEGLAIVQEQLPDLVLLDVILPDLNGIQICHRIKTNPKLRNTFVLLLTRDRIERETQAVCFESGADGYLIRSIPNKVLLASIESLFRTKHTVDALRESEERYRQLVENVSEVIYSIGSDFMILEVSPSVERLLGYKPEELIGKPFNELNIISEEYLEIALSDTMRVFSGERITGSIYEFITRGGSRRLGEVSGSPLVRNGQIVASVSVARDITERERAKEALLESEQRYRELFERMSSGVAVYEAIDDGADFIFKDFNAAGERIEQIDRKKILGKRVTKAFPGVKTTGLLDVFKRVWKTGKPEFLPPAQYFDERFPEGWRENWVYRLPSGEIVAVYNDVTEQRQNELIIKDNEARYRSLFQNSPIALWEEDFSEIKEYLDQLREGGVSDFRQYFIDHPESIYDSVSKIRILDLNASTLELHQAESKEQLLSNLHKIFCKESYNAFREELINIAEGLRFFDLEATIQTVQGEQKQTLIRWSTAPGSEVSLKRVYISVTDITQLKQIEDRLKTSLAEKEVLLREVHHRVKNNLEVIASLANMQFSAIQEPIAKQSILELEERIRTIALVHENLYQYTNLSQVRTRSYLMKLTDNLFQAFSPGGIDLILELSEIPLDIEIAIPCGLIVTELVTNAFKYAFPKGWKPQDGFENNEIHVKLWMEEIMVNLEVSDNGIGQSPEFDWRTARTLGLRLVNRLVTQLHGILTVEIDHGTKYRLEFAHPEGAVHG